MPQFPPEGFAVIRHHPHFWTPAKGDVLVGYVCDPRPDCVGILVTSSESQDPSKACTHGAIEVGQLIHVRSSRDVVDALAAVIEEQGDKTVTVEIAIKNEEDMVHTLGPLSISFAIKLVAPVAIVPAVSNPAPPVTMEDALARTLGLRSAPKVSSPPIPAQPQHAEKPAESPTPAPASPTPATST